VQTLFKVQSLKSQVQGSGGEDQSQQSEAGAGGAGPETINHQLSTIDSPEGLLVFPQMAGTKSVAQRISPKEAMENLRIMEQLQRWLSTNVQEALALEVGLLKLHL
jgi:hypothetical protein